LELLRRETNYGSLLLLLGNKLGETLVLLDVGEAVFEDGLILELLYLFHGGFAS